MSFSFDSSSALFKDRYEAGKRLGDMLSHYRDKDVVVLGLPRGGVPVAYEVALKLAAPLDVFTVRKLGTPGHPELAMGAIATGGVRVLHDQVLNTYSIPQEELDRVTEEELQELRRRESSFRRGRETLLLEGKIAILIDDGLATGSTMRAAIQALRQHQPEKIVAAVPVSSPEVCDQFEPEVDEMICAETPTPFRAVGLWYQDFAQTTDDEVRELLESVPAP